MRLRAVALGVTLVSGGVLVASKVHASAPPLVAISDADPLSLAAAVWRMGDEGVLADLRPGVSVVRRLAAIRAARWMRAPEDALSPLIALVRERDPELSRAAAHALAVIARELHMDALARREVVLGDLKQARAALSELAAVEHLPADVRANLAGAALSLQLAGVP